MSKCFICGSRKGKRKCAQGTSMVCSQCCGETRKRETCEGCAYFRDGTTTRRYLDVPRFSTQQMDSGMDLQTYANTIEGALCLWDHNHERRLTDHSALTVLEMLLDKYHFGDSEVSRTEEFLKEGVDMVVEAIDKDLGDVPIATIIRILGVIYFVARRRTQGQREYLGILLQYVGPRVGPGMRSLPHAFE
jgi:hypothetical protein